MKGISRRARTCAVVAATGVAVLAASSAAANAQRPRQHGDGLPTGQTGMQMFNFGGYINGTGRLEQKPRRSRSSSRSCSPRASASWSSYSLARHAGRRTFRALLDKYNLHCAGWHGGVTEAGVGRASSTRQDPRPQFIGSGGFAAPGRRQLRQTLRHRRTLNRLGKYSVEAGVGPVYIHNHTQRVRRQVRRQRRPQDGVADPHGPHRRALRRRRDRRRLGLRRLRRRHRTRSRA